MPAQRNRSKRENFNSAASLPFQIRLEDFEIATHDDRRTDDSVGTIARLQMKS
jgi:hypothetical protein